MSSDSGDLIFDLSLSRAERLAADVMAADIREQLAQLSRTVSLSRKVADALNAEESASMTEDNNPKRARALLDNKAPLEYVPGGSLEGAARVLKHGADKYGKFNWRIEKIVDSTYVGAFRRHLEAWIDGEDIDPDSGEHHLDHVMANCIIIRDAIKHGTLIEDRNTAEVLGRDDSQHEYNKLIEDFAAIDGSGLGFERSTN